MKKTILLLLLAFAAQGPLRAQLVLDESTSQYQLNATVDYDSTYAYPPSTPRPALGANQTWNLSNAPIIPNTYYVYLMLQPGSNDFPESDLIVNSFTPIAGNTYFADNQQIVTEEGRFEIGQRIKRQAIPVGGLTGNPADSLVFPTQNVVYDRPERLIVFPTSLGQTWRDTFQKKHNFRLSVTPFGLNNVPGERRSRWILHREVISWGNMTVRNAANMPSATHPVVGIRTTRIIRDSFFLLGQPAPATLLAAFGLQQGQIGGTYIEEYYRANEAVPLCEVVFSNINFDAINDFATHLERVGSASSNTNTAPALRLEHKIYPNPTAASGMLRVDLGGQSGNWQFELNSFDGRTLLQQQVQDGSTLPLNASLPPGLYAYRLWSQQDAATGSGVLEIK
jgi:hypothetical protein